MFRDEVATCAALVGKARIICELSTDRVQLDRAVEMLTEAEHILLRPPKQTPEDRRGEWAEQKRKQRSRSEGVHAEMSANVRADMSADILRVRAGHVADAEVEGVVVEVEGVGAEPEEGGHGGKPDEEPSPQNKGAKVTWLTPVEQALDRTGFTIPKSGTPEAKAFYSWLGKELSRSFKIHGGTDREKFTAYVVWVIEEDVGGRWPADMGGDPLKCVRWLSSVLRNVDTLERYKKAQAKEVTPEERARLDERATYISDAYNFAIRDGLSFERAASVKQAVRGGIPYEAALEAERQSAALAEAPDGP